MQKWQRQLDRLLPWYYLHNCEDGTWSNSGFLKNLFLYCVFLSFEKAQHFRKDCLSQKSSHLYTDKYCRIEGNCSQLSLCDLPVNTYRLWLSQEIIQSVPINFGVNVPIDLQNQVYSMCEMKWSFVSSSEKSMRIAGNADSSVQENREGSRGNEEGNSILTVLDYCWSWQDVHQIQQTTTSSNESEWTIRDDKPE